MFLLHNSSFCSIPPSNIPFVFNNSLKQRNLFLHQQPFPSLSHKKPKASTFKIFSAGFLDGITEIAHNKVLIAATASMLIGQISKPFTSVFLYGKEFDIKTFFQAGGFPSSHSSATVAAATFFGLDRGFSDPIFGLTVVYAGLIMYDAQGVRREVGIHGRTLNKLILLQIHLNSLHSKDKDDLINYQPGSSTPLNVEGLEKSLLSQETTSLKPQKVNAPQLVKSRNKIRQIDEDPQPSSFSEDAEEISKLVADFQLPLKESIGHTEVEVIAGALLGILVGFSIHNLI
ncbi:PREDICTED: uncharacterized protein LOC109338457 [Lupinus angustifolius]|uniref:uncharacterized protein LOC109338457 n=1 Tax=Lupinus angustifolius TaxID=3871 RepID=UPI00092E4B02|nr:PREDICTED: uncharacterized protein LOC109338457 [Lupinus angustifolius]